MIDTINKEFKAHLTVASKIQNLAEPLKKIANLCIDSLKNGNKIVIFGNGGSAADAQHIAAELVGRYKISRKGLAAIALTTDTSAITSIGNDFGYENIFSRQVEALVNAGDIVLGISTSGNSENVILGLKKAQEIGGICIGFSGNSGGKMNDICTLNLVIPSDDTPRIQEMHILIGHTLCQLIENQ